MRPVRCKKIRSEDQKLMALVNSVPANYHSQWSLLRSFFRNEKNQLKHTFRRHFQLDQFLSMRAHLELENIDFYPITY